MAEASMVFRRDMWEEKQFKEHVQGEGYTFLNGRREECLDMPYLFSMIAVNHGRNVTGKTRLYTGKIEQNKKGNGIKDWMEAMDEETQDHLDSIRRILMKPKETEEE